MSKKLLTTLGIVVGILAVAFLLWYFLFKTPGVPVVDSVRNVLPFGSSDGLQTQPIDEDLLIADSTFESRDQFGSPLSDMFRISNIPVAGFVIFEEGDNDVVRYIERSTGHIYDAVLPPASTSTSNQLTKTRITNETMPKVYEAYFRSDGERALLRSLREDTDEVENTYITLIPPEEEEEFYNIVSTPLRGSVGSVAVGSGNTLFYNMRDTANVASAGFGGTSVKNLLNVPFTDWRLVSNGGNLIIHTKASASAPGYAYRLTSGGSLTKILGPFNGLVVEPSSSVEKVVYSYIQNREPRTVVEDLSEESMYEILPQTLAEKCVWGSGEVMLYCGVPRGGVSTNEPDLWYRGETRFSDDIWSFNTNSETEDIVYEPTSRLGISVDVLEPTLSIQEDYLVFINKLDLSLWALRLK